MKKAFSLVVEDDDLIELMHILMNEDADGALPFSKRTSRAKRAICWKAVEKSWLKCPGQA